MPTLFIAPGEELSKLHCSSDFFQAEEPNRALSILETEDIERIVFDARSEADSQAALEELIAVLPVTTRLLAIVEKLPSSQICADAGVIYLTPPVKSADIAWFLGCEQSSPQ